MAVLSLPDNDAPASEKEKEKARLEQKLEAKSLKELMALQRAMEKEAQEKAAVLHAVQQGDLSALKPYLRRESGSNYIRISDEDLKQRSELITQKHLRDVHFVEDAPEKDVEKALLSREKRLKELFPRTNIDVRLVHAASGKALIETTGVSDEELLAALRLERQQKEAANKSDAVKEAIQHKISKPSQQASNPPNEHEPVLLARTPPQAQKDAIARGGSVF